jgi:hypothetical protein
MIKSRDQRLNSINISDILPAHSLNNQHNNQVDSTSASQGKPVEDGDVIGQKVHQRN